MSNNSKLPCRIPEGTVLYAESKIMKMFDANPTWRMTRSYGASGVHKRRKVSNFLGIFSFKVELYTRGRLKSLELPSLLNMRNRRKLKKKNWRSWACALAYKHIVSGVEYRSRGLGWNFKYRSWLWNIVRYRSWLKLPYSVSARERRPLVLPASCCCDVWFWWPAHHYSNFPLRQANLLFASGRF